MHQGGGSQKVETAETGSSFESQSRTEGKPANSFFSNNNFSTLFKSDGGGPHGRRQTKLVHVHEGGGLGGGGKPVCREGKNFGQGRKWSYGRGVSFGGA